MLIILLFRMQVKHKETQQSNIGANDRKIPPQKVDKIVKELGDISFKELELLRLYFQDRPIRQAHIRDSILIEGMQLVKPKAILIVDGTIGITKKLGVHAEHMRDFIDFAELSGTQFVGLQSIINNNVIKYTVTARSGFVDFVEILDPAIIQIVFRSLREVILQREKKRDRQFKKMLKQGQKKSDSDQKRQLVERLSLPNIKLYGNLEKLGTKIKSTSKLPKMQHSSSSTKNIRDDKKITLHLSQKHPGFQRDPANFSLKQLPRKSPKSIQSSKVSITAPERSQKLFKQHLKHIIKRKLVYQRKQLGVLKAFRQNTDGGDMIVNEVRPGISHQGSDIDQYFRI